MYYTIRACILTLVFFQGSILILPQEGSKKEDT